MAMEGFLQTCLKYDAQTLYHKEEITYDLSSGS